MKRIIPWILILLLLCGCGGTPQATQSTPETTQAAETLPEDPTPCG